MVLLNLSNTRSLPRNGARWTVDEITILINCVCNRTPLSVIAKMLNRSVGGIIYAIGVHAPNVSKGAVNVSNGAVNVSNGAAGAIGDAGAIGAAAAVVSNLHQLHATMNVLKVQIDDVQTLLEKISASGNRPY